MTQEKWIDIPQYVGLYQASDLGRIRSLKRKTTSGKVLKQHINKRNGYSMVSLSKDNNVKTMRVHVLIMQAFNPVSKHYGYDKDWTIDHINGIKTDNRLENLEWCTQSENQKRAYANGLNGKCVKPVIDLDTGAIYESATAAAASVGGGKCRSITRVCNGQRSQYRNHHFAFLCDYENGSIPKFNGAFKKRSAQSLWR